MKEQVGMERDTRRWEGVRSQEQVLFSASVFILSLLRSGGKLKSQNTKSTVPERDAGVLRSAGDRIERKR